MTYGVQLFGCSKEFRKDTYKFFDEMKSAGLTQIEPCIMFDEPEEFRQNALKNGNTFAATFPDLLWLPHEVKGFIQELKKRGMCLTSAHIFAASIKAVLPKMISLAKECGITSYVVNTPDTAVENPDEFCGEMTFAAAELKKAGVELWLHNSGKDFIKKISLDGKDIPVYLYILKKSVGLYAQVDTGWVIVGDIDPREFITENISLIRGIHFKDMDKDFKNKSGADIFAVLGDGCIDVKGIMEVIPKNMPVVIDQDLSKGDFIEDLKKSAKVLIE